MGQASGETSCVFVPQCVSHGVCIPFCCRSDAHVRPFDRRLGVGMMIPVTNIDSLSPSTPAWTDSRSLSLCVFGGLCVSVWVCMCHNTREWAAAVFVCKSSCHSVLLLLLLWLRKWKRTKNRSERRRKNVSPYLPVSVCQQNL